MVLSLTDRGANPSEAGLKMIRAMILDLDGTLVKTEWLKGLSYAKAARVISPTPVAVEAVQAAFASVVGRSREEVSTALLNLLGLEGAARAQMAAYDAHFPRQVLARARMKIYE